MGKLSFAKKQLSQLKCKIYLLDACLYLPKLARAVCTEVNMARNCNFPKGSVLVADRGYVDYKWLNDLDSSSCFFVTKTKSHIAYKVEVDCSEKGLEFGSVRRDHIITLKTKRGKKDYPRRMHLVNYLAFVARIKDKGPILPSLGFLRLLSRMHDRIRCPEY